MLALALNLSQLSIRRDASTLPQLEQGLPEHFVA